MGCDIGRAGDGTGADGYLCARATTACLAGKCVLDLGCNSGHITRAIVAEGAKLALGVSTTHAVDSERLGSRFLVFLKMFLLFVIDF